MSINKIIVPMLMTIILSACSGGSSPSSSNPSQVTSLVQTISLTNPGPIDKTFGQPNFTNLAYGGLGTGDITYSSSDTNIATVNVSTGEVNITSVGTTTITATKAADGQYAAANVSYNLIILPDTQSIDFTDPGPISKKYGDVNFTNIASGGAGSGAISYSSSDNSVANVDADSGEVSVNLPGLAIITATKAADNYYSAATTSYTISIPKLVQEITFADTGPIYKSTNSANFTNIASGGLGTGSVVYNSSDTSVARVNFNTGEVGIYRDGTTTITALKYGDEIHSPVQTSYNLVVSTNSVTLKAWVGNTNTQVSFDQKAKGLNFIRSTDKNCDLANYSLCPKGQLDTLTNTIINDTAANANQTAWYWLQHGDINSQAADLALPNFTPRTGLQTVEFDNKLWLIGGFDGSYKNDVWSSDNGIIWTQETAKAAFSARADHQLLNFNNKLWLIGGWDGSMKNDVWSSDNGIHWTQVTDNAAFSARYGHRTVVFNNRMWLIAGWDGGIKHDAWSSSDGITWIPETAAATFSARYDHQLEIFNDKMWLIGGRGNTNKNDVWSSSDGITWIAETTAAAFSTRHDHQVRLFNNKLWLIGGNDGVKKNDVWSSTDGITWIQESGSAEFPAPNNPQLLSFDNKLILIEADNGSTESHVWSSTDGVNWRQGFYNTIYFQ